MDQPAPTKLSGPPSPHGANDRGGHVELIARGLLVHASHVLLCKNLDAGYFYFPGGHVEFGEGGAVALEREMMEEAGVSVRAGRCVLVGECSFEQKGRRRHEINLVFHVEHAWGDHGSPPPVPSLEPHIAFEWVRLDSLRVNDIRPKWLAEWVSARAARLDTAADQHGPEWVSHMCDSPK